MREIEFRGKIKEKPDQWIYGSYIEGLEVEHSIGQQQEVKGIIFYFQNTDWDLPRPIKGMEVLKNTVGQYTGLKDKNGKKIYEGDIVRRLYGVNYTSKRHPSFKNNTAKINIAVIEYDIENGGYSYLSSPGDYNFQCEYEVIGNIYDNDIDALTHKYCKNEPDFSDFNDPF